MKRSIAVAVVVFAVAGAYWVLQAGNLDPPGPPAPTFKTLDEVEPRTPIQASDLPMTISSPGSFYLVENISTAGGGIVIKSSSVTIDLMGFSLSDGTGDGIDVFTAENNVVVKNGTVSGWQFNGVDLINAPNSLVMNVHAEGNGGIGIQIGQNSSVINSAARNNGTGIDGGSGSIVSGCMALENTGDGIRTRAGSIIRDSTSKLNDGNGFNLIQSDSMILNCVAHLNDGDGIQVGNRNYVRGNHCISNGISGVGAGVHATSINNTIEGNNVQGNDFGILVDTNRNVIIRNTAIFNFTNYSIVAGNTVGTIVTTEAAMNAATNDLVNISTF